MRGRWYARSVLTHLQRHTTKQRIYTRAKSGPPEGREWQSVTISTPKPLNSSSSPHKRGEDHHARGIPHPPRTISSVRGGWGCGTIRKRPTERARVAVEATKTKPSRAIAPIARFSKARRSQRQPAATTATSRFRQLHGKRADALHESVCDRKARKPLNGGAVHR